MERKMRWKAPVRNYDRVQHEGLRREVDGEYNDFHDQLSAAYYNSESFSHPWLVDWGYDAEIDFAKLKSADPKEAKVLFDEIHALQDLKRQEKFHATNMAKPLKQRIAEEEYNLITDESGEIIGKRSDEIETSINNIANKLSNRR